MCIFEIKRNDSFQMSSMSKRAEFETSQMSWNVLDMPTKFKEINITENETKLSSKLSWKVKIHVKYVCNNL